MLAHVSTVVGLHALVVAVQRLHHELFELAGLVARQQIVPALAPQQLDDVPAGAAEVALQLLDDLAVATHRAVQALQVAVDDEDQVVEVLARGQADGALALRLVHLAVAQEYPDLAVLGVGDATRIQILEKARLVDRHQRAQAHADGGELPELGHQLGVRVARQALAAGLLAEVFQLVFGDAAFEVGAGIDAGRAVALEVDAVAAVAFALGMPEMVEAGAPHAGERGKRADVAAQIAAVVRCQPIGAHHHGHGVPAHVGTQALLDGDVAGRARFLRRLQRVHVAGGGRKRQINALLARVFQQFFEQRMGAFGALAFDDGGQRVQPFTGFLGVDLGCGFGRGLGFL